MTVLPCFFFNAVLAVVLLFEPVCRPKTRRRDRGVMHDWRSTKNAKVSINERSSWIAFFTKPEIQRTKTMGKAFVPTTVLFPLHGSSSTSWKRRVPIVHRPTTRRYRKGVGRGGCSDPFVVVQSRTTRPFFSSALPTCFSFFSNLLLSTDLDHAVTTTMAQSLSPDVIEPSFAPVLNGPAFVSFAIIAILFGLLQWRIQDIEKAVVARRAALAILRDAKARELSDGGIGTGGVVGGDDSSSPSSVMAQEALRDYRNAYDKVQTLREIAPGVRIRAPNIMDAENARAAQQFLGITDASGETEASSSSSKTGVVDSSSSSPEDENPLVPKLALAVLVMVGLSQLALWMFMVSLDDPFPLSF
jgi:hypothetical protein